MEDNPLHLKKLVGLASASFISSRLALAAVERYEQYSTGIMAVAFLSIGIAIGKKLPKEVRTGLGLPMILAPIAAEIFNPNYLSEYEATSLIIHGAGILAANLGSFRKQASQEE